MDQDEPVENGRVFWWTWRELNPRPPARQAGALPLSYRPLRYPLITRIVSETAALSLFRVGCSRTSSAGSGAGHLTRSSGSLRPSPAYYFRSSLYETLNIIGSDYKNRQGEYPVPKLRAPQKGTYIFRSGLDNVALSPANPIDNLHIHVPLEFRQVRVISGSKPQGAEPNLSMSGVGNKHVAYVLEWLLRNCSCIGFGDGPAIQKHDIVVINNQRRLVTVSRVRE